MNDLGIFPSLIGKGFIYFFEISFRLKIILKLKNYMY